LSRKERKFEHLEQGENHLLERRLSRSDNCAAQWRCGKSANILFKGKISVEHSAVPMTAENMPQKKRNIIFNGKKLPGRRLDRTRKTRSAKPMFEEIASKVNVLPLKWI